jgi:hypothetical protein
MKKIVLIFCLGIVLGFIISKLILKPQIDYVYKKTFKTDTIYYSLPKDTVYLTKEKIKHSVLRDTVLIGPIKPILKAFTAYYPLEYGNIYITGEVIGEVTKLGFSNDLKIPVVTNTIREEKIKTLYNKGLYLGGGVNNFNNPVLSVNANYVTKDIIIGYQYSFNKSHGLNFSKRLF